VKVQITAVVRTIEVPDAHVAWCVQQAYHLTPARFQRPTRRRRAERIVADSLGTTPGDIAMAVRRHEETVDAGA
jgi:hypothetical protein